IKRKLMGLDFVLAHPAYQYLATEREKLTYFTATWGISSEDLPTRWYESPQGRLATAKYFVDKYPLFLATPDPVINPGTTAPTLPQAKPVVHFSYVDEGAQGTGGFATYLHQYSRLLTALPEFRIIYIAQDSRFFDSARRIFQQVLNACAHAPTDPRV